MGDAALLQAFPLYSFFQQAKIGLFDRFDVLYSSSWIMGIFIKSVLMIYCASISFTPMKNKTKCFLCAVIVFAASIFISQFTQSGTISPLTYVIPFVIFCVLLPLTALIFKKKKLW